jgi:hypothetical protein
MFPLAIGTLSNVSRGIGRTQQAILDRIDASGYGRLSVTDLARMLDLDERQVRRAVYSLADRELVTVKAETVKLSGGRWAPKKLYVQRAGALALYRAVKQHVDDNFPKGVSVPTPDEASEEEAIRSVQKQFTDAGFECPEDTARGLVQEAYKRHREQSGG